MKTALKEIFATPKDAIALIVILSWCIAIFLPEYLVDEITQRSFERIIMMVIGFYFGSHTQKPKPGDKHKCPYIEDLREASINERIENE